MQETKNPEAQPRSASCRCGNVVFIVSGRAIVSVDCYCTSCQEAAHHFEQLPRAAPVLNADGGTAFLLYRKDRIHCERGEEHLVEHRLKPDAPSRRVLATCCNAPMFLEMKGGHWLSMYRARFGEQAPAVEMRTMTRDRPAGVELSPGVPSYATHSGKFMWRLLSAWVAMGFRAPSAPYGLRRMQDLAT